MSNTPVTDTITVELATCSRDVQAAWLAQLPYFRTVEANLRRPEHVIAAPVAVEGE